jgi:[methyl-Co(III) methanol-specific corrinoid protein]:coenzyme M methyltransferase
MTSRERVLAALRHEPVERTPVCNPTSVATVELMDLVDAHFPDANRDPEQMAWLAATSYTELGFDTIMPDLREIALAVRDWHREHAAW